MTDAQQRAAAIDASLEALRLAFDQHDEQAFTAAFGDLKASLDPTVLMEVRQVARNLQAALDQFHSNSRLLDLAERQVPDARQRLAHVLKLTDEAAHRTMDLVDQSCPLIDAIAREAERLSTIGNGPTPDRLTLAVDMHGFLGTALTSARAVRGMLTDVLLTQGYQDLSGQIIRGVMKLVDELEVALGALVRIGALTAPPGEEHPETPSHGYGPVVPGINHGNSVSGQQDVDAMLLGLGM